MCLVDLVLLRRHDHRGNGDGSRLHAGRRFSAEFRASSDAPFDVQQARRSAALTAAIVQ